MNADPLALAAAKVQRSWTSDGLADISAGATLLLPAFWEWGKTQLSPSSRAWQVLNWGMILSIIILPSLFQWLLPRFRNRFLSRRAGYSLPLTRPEYRRRSAVVAGIAAVIAMSIAIWLARHKPPGLFLPGFIAIGSAVLLCQLGWHASVGRYFLLAPVFLLLGAVTMAWAGSLSEALIWQFGGMGLLLIASGLLTLCHWLARNPPLEETAQ